MVAALLLLWAAASATLFDRGWPADRRRPPGGTDAGSRRRRYRRWVARAALAFGLPSLAGPLLLGRGDAFRVLPREFRPLAARLPDLSGEAGVLAGALLVGALLGAALSAAVLRLRRGRDWRTAFGDPGPLVPRVRGELLYAAAVSLVAGVTEEGFSRLLLPLLVALLLARVGGGTGWGAAAGFALSTLLFGFMHRYQGRRGAVAATVMGAALSALYLMTGRLWLAVGLHVLADLNGLVLRPALTGAWRVSGPPAPGAGQVSR